MHELEKGTHMSLETQKKYSLGVVANSMHMKILLGYRIMLICNYINRFTYNLILYNKRGGLLTREIDESMRHDSGWKMRIWYWSEISLTKAVLQAPLPSDFIRKKFWQAEHGFLSQSSPFSIFSDGHQAPPQKRRAWLINAIITSKEGPGLLSSII